MTNIQEIWKPIKNYEGLYEVSNLGRVRSLPRGGKFGQKDNMFEGKILTEKKHYAGYKLVTLSNNGHSYKSIHSLVAHAFLDKPNYKVEVNHKDGDKANNRVENLEFVSPSQNLKHAYSNGLKVPNYKKYGKREYHSPVYVYDQFGFLLLCFQSITDCAKFLSKPMRLVSGKLIKYKTFELNNYYISKTNFTI